MKSSSCVCIKHKRKQVKMQNKEYKNLRQKDITRLCEEKMQIKNIQYI